MTRNGFNGLRVRGAETTGVADVTAVDSMATNNGTGFIVEARGLLRLARSAATENSCGVFVGAGGTVESFGDNVIRGNTTNVTGTLTHVALQ